MCWRRFCSKLINAFFFFIITSSIMANRSLSCQRITLHKNLFCSYVLNSALTILYLVTVVNNPKLVKKNPVSRYWPPGLVMHANGVMFTVFTRTPTFVVYLETVEATGKFISQRLSVTCPMS